MCRCVSGYSKPRPEENEDHHPAMAPQAGRKLSHSNQPKAAAAAAGCVSEGEGDSSKDQSNSVDILLYYLRPASAPPAQGTARAQSSSSSSPAPAPPWPFLAFFLFTRPGRPPPYGERREKSMCFWESRRTMKEGMFTTCLRTLGGSGG